ncbi:hypothetical protein GOBAR_AA15090 [Gossypium barbadense]|uniref:Uncharacterized protein n=1 Tax=Gossypium barbadense TaxID=3634 RepID=A0A2P5XQJ0_GOSBA|nr:hypothetical protein GOBAR_AA15090 [Gossypium barbadense]
MVIYEPKRFINLNFCKTEGDLSRIPTVVVVEVKGCWDLSEYKLMDLSLCKTDGDGKSLGSFVSSPLWSDGLPLTSPKVAAPELLKEKVEEK